MPLPAPEPREHFHTRSVVFGGYHRRDGLWDIEAELTDRKPYGVELYGQLSLQPGDPIHHLSVRLTMDGAFVIRGVATSMDATPFGECQQAKPPLQSLVGVQIGPGWRQSIEAAMGGVRGCTHLRELLFNMATAAYQTIPSGQARLRGAAGAPEAPRETPPYHVGRCVTWDANGPVVARHYPQFVGWQPLKRMAKRPG
ncbi:MAG TPA: DUF2889 domain-containing protein [Ramlibacter sp.]|nr:DUF2889 domain-containing protein [Ramlibacter sp.]